MNNKGTEETVAEEERICSKGAMGELKSDDTKPTEQKVSGGHLMTEADSLRTNADSEADTTTGYENTEGSSICKVNIIRQADQNSEALWIDKPVQETGAKDLTRGNLECQKHMEMGLKRASNERHAWEMTWDENTLEKPTSKGTEKWDKDNETKSIDLTKGVATQGCQKPVNGSIKQIQEIN